VDRYVPEPHEQRSVAFFLTSSLTTMGGWVALNIVLGALMFDLTHSELDLGLLGLAEFAPAALLVLVSGSLADRFNRRHLAAGSAAVSACFVAALGWYASTEPTSPLPFFILVLCFGTSRTLGQPAFRTLPADIVRPERLPWLTIRTSGTMQVAAIVGPIAGGALLDIDTTLPFVVITVLMLVGAGLLLLVKVGPHAHQPSGRRRTADAQRRADAELEAIGEATRVEPVPAPGTTRLHDALEGLRFIRRQQALLGAISLDLFAVLFGGAPALLPAIADERLHVDALGLGVLRSAIGIGAALMVIGLAIRPITRKVGRNLFISVAVFGLGTVVLGATESFVVAFLALAVLSAADAVSMYIRATLVPLITPVDKRGRVSAVEMVFIGASNELGAFESGVAGQLLGPGGAIVLGGVGTLVVTGLWYRWFPSLRKVDRFPGLEERSRGATPVPDSGSESERETSTSS
jgi:MFS family permease